MQYYSNERGSDLVGLSVKCLSCRDFRIHVDPEFGNCFTFNYDVNRNYTSSRAGPMYGIRVLLFVNTSDYMSTSESAGVRLAIHDPTEYPFPDTFGFSAPVGFASSFGMKKGCYRSCFQANLIRECSCGDPRFPVPKSSRHCPAFNASARECLRRFLDYHGDFHHATSDEIYCDCKQRCKEVVYEVTFSASRWPALTTDVR
ncbi:hypothetical protein GCK32_018611 [Trichostrongylus colubriformis]|uniref:Uncharacterized protein n=1 Tax=Trichostrongylus colubriformis TaxID=6319 RepID=A0AAN8FZ15_TRICO